MKPYEEVCFPSGILRWIREGDEYVCRLTEDQMRQIKELHETPYTKTYSGGKPNYTQPIEQEPVAWMNPNEESAGYAFSHTYWEGGVFTVPLYTAPQPEQEPVAWVSSLDFAQPHCVTDLKYCTVSQHERGEHLKYTPLYKDPTPCKTCEALARTVMMDQTSHDTKKEWVGLTDEEIEGAIDEGFALGLDDGNVSNKYVIRYARAIEAKLKEKNDAA